jgi:hypothetical protein
MFEELSGSSNFKSECDSFKQKILDCDESVRKDTEGSPATENGEG